jgi:hypothetical protein
MIQTPFDVTFDIPTTVAQAQEFHINARITNALNRSLSGIKITIGLPDDFGTAESLTRNIEALLSGESVDVSWLVVATDLEYGYTPVTIYISSAEGINAIATTSLTVLRLPELKIFSTAPIEVQKNIAFEFTIYVTNQGDLSLQSVSVTLSLPDNAIASDVPTEHIGDLAGGEMKSISWTITPMLDEDFWISVNASDVTSTHSAHTTELINVVIPEIELNLLNPVEAMLDQDFPVTAEIKNIGELVATEVKVRLTLPSELITTDPIDIDIGDLSPEQSQVVEWTIKGITPGYAEITVNASASSISATRGVIITDFPLSVKTDKKTYLTGDNVIITTTTTNENPEVSYIDLLVNLTIECPGVKEPYSMPIDFISSSETRNFALTWDSTGKPFGDYVIVAKILENTTVLNEVSTSFALTAVDTIPPTTLLTIGEPKYLDLMGNIYVSFATPFTLTAEDNPDGTGVASTFYRIYNSSYDTGWPEYSAPFYLTGLSDGEYSIDYYSTDNIGNTEPTDTATVILDNTPPPALAVEDVTLSRTVVAQNRSMSINVTVANLGNTSETFDVTLYANRTLDAYGTPDSNSTLVAKIQNVTLENGTSATIPFTWNTTGFAFGNYTITANATILPGDTDPTNNAMVDGTVVVSIVGDVNGDYRVTANDYMLVKKAIPSLPGDSNWNPKADTSYDNIVDGLDYQIVKKNLGKHVP